MNKKKIKAVLLGLITIITFNSCEKDSNSTPTPSPTPSAANVTVKYLYNAIDPYVDPTGVSYPNHVNTLFTFNATYTDVDGTLKNEIITLPFNKTVIIPASKRPVDIVFKIDAKLKTTLIDSTAKYNLIRYIKLEASDANGKTYNSPIVNDKIIGAEGSYILKYPSIFENIASYYEVISNF